MGKSAILRVQEVIPAKGLTLLKPASWPIPEERVPLQCPLDTQQPSNVRRIEHTRTTFVNTTRASIQLLLVVGTAVALVRAVHTYTRLSIGQKGDKGSSPRKGSDGRFLD
jgi:hypothetical protein